MNATSAPSPMATRTIPAPIPREPPVTRIILSLRRDTKTPSAVSAFTNQRSHEASLGEAEANKQSSLKKRRAHQRSCVRGSRKSTGMGPRSRHVSWVLQEADFAEMTQVGPKQSFIRRRTNNS